MRVLLTTDTIGGVWTFTKELAIGLLEKGHSVGLVSFGGKPTPSQQAWCSATEAIYEDLFCSFASSTPLEWMVENEHAYTNGEALLLRLADEFQPDVFHSSQFCFGKLPWSGPTVVTAHSDVLSWAESCRPGGLPPSAWLSRYLRVVREGIDGAEALVAPTQWMADALSRNFDLPAAPQVIANGRSLPPVENQTARRMRAVSVGRLWDEGKNLGILAEVTSPVPIVVAGERSLDEDSGTSSFGRIAWLGALAEDEVLRAFRASSVYLALSTYEPFGLAPLEAALCGCAVLANDIPSFREIWGDTAIYFRGAAELSACLDELAGSPDLLRTMQKRGTNRATEFTRSAMTDRYLDLYNNLLHKKHSTPRPIVGNRSAEMMAVRG